MRYFFVFSFTLLLLTFFPLAFSHVIFATTTVSVSNNGDNSNSNVHVESNTGDNTICQNGKCVTTSTEGTSKSTVCVNGNCTTSEGSNVDVKSENGTTTVHVDGKTPDTNKTIVKENFPEREVTPTKTVKPTGWHKEASIAAKKNEMKAKAQEQHFDLGHILRRFHRFMIDWIW